MNRTTFGNTPAALRLAEKITTEYPCSSRWVTRYIQDYYIHLKEIQIIPNKVTKIRIAKMFLTEARITIDKASHPNIIKSLLQNTLNAKYQKFKNSTLE
jgi:hypothetical protein